MTRYLIIFLYSLSTVSCFAQPLILSTPDQLAVLTSDPANLIGGIICPISGHPVLQQTDFVVNGAQSIALTRMYIPPYIPSTFPKRKQFQAQQDERFFYSHLLEHYQGWQFFPHLRLQFNPKLHEVRLTEPNGATFDFNVSGFKTTLASPSYAINNVSGDEPSGKYDPRNINISIEDGGNKIVVYAADGTARLYYKRNAISKYVFGYLLHKETLPNGKVIKYHYDKKMRPIYVESMDPQERYVYASVFISGSPNEGYCRFISSSGKIIDYGYRLKSLHSVIEGTTKGNKPFKDILDGNYPPVLTFVNSPAHPNETLDYFGGFLLNAYSGKDHVFVSQHSSFGNTPHYRVQKLLRMVGQNNTIQQVYEINYQPPIAGEKEGSTYVKNSDGTSCIYHFSKNLLTTSIEYFGQDGELIKQKNLSWNEKNWLVSIEMIDGQNKLLYKKTYEFDSCGNPILEVSTGQDIENTTVRREFSKNGRNLILREEHENGKTILFSYLPHTNLVTEKLIKDQDIVVSREFFDYNDCYHLIRAISDDGKGIKVDDLTGVCQRTIKNYILRQEAPFLHMPDWIEEKHMENGEERLLKHIYFIYDQHGNIAQEEVAG
ncbi:MAG: hypothetical protein WCF65_05135 [Parachlamydiaceae bacterium]